MDITMTFVLMALISATTTVLVKAIWEWAANKNGNKKINEIQSSWEDKFKNLKCEFDKKLEEKFSYVKHIKEGIDKQREEFSDLKEAILTSYVNKTIYDKHIERFEHVRDLTLKNENNISMARDSVRQNINRISKIEND